MARFALSCPALPTCGLALTEAERMHGEMVDGFDALLARHGLGQRRLSVRITGCPNGCARTYAGDIGIVGRMPGFYAIYTGGDFEGTRLSFKLLEKVPHAEVISLFDAHGAGRVGEDAAGKAECSVSKHFLFEKRRRPPGGKQKTFNFAAGAGHKSFLLLFFKKEVLTFPLATPPPGARCRVAKEPMRHDNT
jgi:hypothetical protein